MGLGLRCVSSDIRVPSAREDHCFHGVFLWCSEEFDVAHRGIGARLRRWRYCRRYPIADM
jgi:hypothetical protein